MKTQAAAAGGEPFEGTDFEALLRPDAERDAWLRSGVARRSDRSLTGTVVRDDQLAASRTLDQRLQAIDALRTARDGKHRER